MGFGERLILIMSTSAPGSQLESVEAEIDFVRADSRINRRYVAPGAELNTGRFGPQLVRIRNGRPVRHELTLDSVGFTLLNHQSSVHDFLDREEVDRVYTHEVTEAVRQLTGASKVVSTGWNIRTSGDPGLLATSVGIGQGSGGIQPPARDAHVDVHPDRASRYARRMYEREVPEGPGYRRFIISSFWRAFSNPPQDYPLAVCDGTSVAADEGVPNVLVIVDTIPDESIRHGPLPGAEQLPAASIFQYRPHHRWWYFPDMTRNEALAFKFFDSDQAGPWRVPHTAFRDPSRPQAHTRRSIECRTVAFFE